MSTSPKRRRTGGPKQQQHQQQQEEGEEEGPLNRLPADVLSYVFGLCVARLEEVAPLARVSKLFNACVRRPSVLGSLGLEPHERLQRLFPNLNMFFPNKEDIAAASAELVATLQQVRLVRLGCPAIRRIDFDSNYHKIPYVRDEHVQLMASFRSLRSVSLAQCVSVTDIIPLQSLTLLTKLDLELCQSIPGSGFACLSSLISLQDLNVGATVINDEGLAGLSMLPAVEKLSMGSCRAVSGSGFACISSMTSLQELDLGCTSIDEEVLAGLAMSFPALTKLDLSGCKSISGAGFACLSSVTSLQELDVPHTYINDEAIAVLSRSLTALAKLNLSFCGSISVSGSACLSSLASLQELGIRQTVINDAGLSRALHIWW